VSPRYFVQIHSYRIVFMHLEAQCTALEFLCLCLHLIAQFSGQSALDLQDVFMYVQITAGRFCAHGVDPLSSRASRRMLDLQDCGGRLSYTLPHSDSVLIISFQFPLHQTPSQLQCNFDILSGNLYHRLH
jgi:hypothetical protein